MKVVIQVPIEKDLLARLDQQATSQKVSRAALIRAACTRYLHQVESEERASRYVEGYRRIPEETSEKESRAWLAAAELPAEEWPEAPRWQA